MGTKDSTQRTGEQPVKAVVKTAQKSVSKEAKVISKEEVRDVLSMHIETMSETKKHRDLLLEKKLRIEEALQEMKTYSKNPKGDFVENNENSESWDFEVVLQKGINSHSKQRIFAINKVLTVERFAQVLLAEISKVLEDYNQEIEEYFNRLKE